jgi:hypothetical protein
MSRDIDKEKKDQRKAECKALRDARKRGVLKTVLSTSNIKEAAKLEKMTPADLTQTLRSYGVKRGAGQYWRHAVKDYMDAGMPHQYELRLHSISDPEEVDWFDDETFEKPWSWVDETELEEQIELDIKKVDYTMNPVVELARKEGERVKYWENKGYQTNVLHTPYRASKAFNPATYNPSEETETTTLQQKFDKAVLGWCEELETKLEQKVEEAILEGKDKAELMVPDPANRNRTIKYSLPL